MTVYFAAGSPDTELTETHLKAALEEDYSTLEERQRVLIVPPDYTRYHSRAGVLTRMTCDYFGTAVQDILPALGTHKPMTDAQLEDMYAGVPTSTPTAVLFF